MPTDTVHQLETIRAMLDRGHRSVRIEQHSLMLWGLAGALLIVVTDVIFSPDHFEVWWQRALASSAFIGAILLAVGFVDYRLTQRSRAQRGESLSFVQRQVTKVWWLLVGLIVALNLGMNFFGGGLMFYPLVLILLGLAFYVHGLFSQQMLTWIGASLIVVGLAGLVFQLPFDGLKWLAACTLGLGFPALAMVLERPAVQATFARRAVLILAWLLLITLSAALVYTTASSRDYADLPEISLADYTVAPAGPAEVAVRIPAGVSVPVQFTIDGGLLHNASPLVVQTLEELRVVVANGKPTGAFRIADGRWLNARESVSIRFTDVRPELLPEVGPRVTMKTTVGLR